jgi:hypothetical protein
MPDNLVPPGFVLVPMEPTLAMFRAFTIQFKDNEGMQLVLMSWLLGSFREDYQAMLAAAPPSVLDLTPYLVKDT